jgi:hypothetical protein
MRLFFFLKPLSLILFLSLTARMLRRKVSCVFGEMRKRSSSGSERHVNNEIYGGEICFTCRIIGAYLGIGCLRVTRIGHNNLAPN